MAEWLGRLVKATRALSDDDLAASASLGAEQSLLCGVTVVGDIVYGPEAPSAAIDAGLGGAFFWEVLGITESELAEELARREYPADPVGCGGRIRCGLTPHSTYTSGPSLIRATHEMARDQGSPWAIHLAESGAESRLLAYGDGPLSGVAERLAFGFHPPRRSAVAYIDKLRALDGAVAVHCTQASPNDAQRLARHARGVVLCPRSNAFLHNGAPPAQVLADAGVPLGLGTDSAASNEDLDLFEEGRALLKIAPALGAERVLRMMTVEGAGILGVDDRLGSLEAGKEADIVVMSLRGGPDPVEALVALGGLGRVRAVMTSGVWRVTGGKPVFQSDAASKIERARAKAEAALAD